MTFRELLGENTYRVAGNPCFDYLAAKVDAVTADVAQAGAGMVFVCVRTAIGNGHECAIAAYGAGCRLFLAERGLPLPDDAAVLVVADTAALLGELADRCLGHPARHLTVLGITGTAGKSTVADTVCALLEQAGHTVAVLTTDGQRIGDDVRPAHSVVPDAVEIHAFLAQAVRAGTDFAVLEFSAYMLARKSSFSIPFAAVLLTNLWPHHIGNGQHAHFADYRAAKASLFAESIPFCILPSDRADFVLTDRTRRILFGQAGDVTAVDLCPYTDHNGFGTRFSLCFATGEKLAVSLPVPGDFAVQNALAAAALARVAGLVPNEIAAGLSAHIPKGRLACIAAQDTRYIYVDTAYTGEDLTRVLQVLRKQTRGKLTVLLGSVGGRARERRSALGAAATGYADFAYFTADDPDCEDPRLICAEMAAGVTDPARYAIVPDRATAIRRAVLEMRPGDTLLLAGKGGCETQLIHSKKIPFSEQKIVEEALLSL